MRIVVTGTDTGIGKTVFAAALAAALGAAYWKPIQSGLEDGADTDTASRLGVRTLLPEAYRLTQPLSPHRAAELDGVTIDPARLTPPDADPLVIEGAGGVLVPVTRDLLFADLFARWALPTVLVSRTTLGTINHSLLSIEALKRRGVPLLGVAFVGEANEDNEATIAAIGGVRRLGRLPRLDRLEPEPLGEAFRTHFHLDDFRKPFALSEVEAPAP
ncbi:MAG TPA: dethiobiotin synthase [Sphingomonas sp.]|nr:dethiobiotin synthase [Sphingomonas sp.]